MTTMELEVSRTSMMDRSLRERRRHRLWPEALKREIVVQASSNQAFSQDPARNPG
jgi:hypothetical protein